MDEEEWHWQEDQISPISSGIYGQAHDTVDVQATRYSVTDRLPPTLPISAATTTVITELVEDLWPQ